MIIVKKELKTCHNCKSLCSVNSGLYVIQKKDGNEYTFCDECFEKIYGKLNVVEVS